MPSYTVTQADRVKTVETQYGEMEVLRLMLSDPDGEKEVEMMQKPGRDLPSGEIEGTISSNQYGLRFKRSRPQGSPNGFKRDPAETASIVRQHSQHMALLWCAIQQKAAPDLKPDFGYLQNLIQQFDDDAKGVR